MKITKEYLETEGASDAVRDWFASRYPNGMEVNALGDEGWTALHSAALRGNIDVVKFLLDNNADVNAKDNNGWTALDMANNGEIREVLQKAMEEEKMKPDKKDVIEFVLITLERALVKAGEKYLSEHPEEFQVREESK